MGATSSSCSECHSVKLSHSVFPGGGGVMVSLCHGVTVPKPYWVMVSPYYGTTVSLCREVLVSWCYSVIVSWSTGVMTPWCHGVMASCYNCNMASICPGIMVSRCHCIMPSCGHDVLVSCMPRSSCWWSQSWTVTRPSPSSDRYSGRTIDHWLCHQHQTCGNPLNFRIFLGASTLSGSQTN